MQPDREYSPTEAAKRIKEAMEGAGLEPTTFAERVGVNRSTVYRWLKGELLHSMPLTRLKQIANVTNVNPTWLLGFTEDKFGMIGKSESIPLLGFVPAGEPIISSEALEGYESIRENESVDFALRVQGCSMTGVRIYDGDVVFVRKQDDVDQGEIAVIRLDGDEVTLKRVYREGRNVVLRSENPTIPEIRITPSDHKKVQIIGKVLFCKFEVR